jgi:hypothetical protein
MTENSISTVLDPTRGLAGCPQFGRMDIGEMVRQSTTGKLCELPRPLVDVLRQQGTVHSSAVHPGDGPFPVV